MSYNRDSNGIFTDGIGMGISGADQIRAGVNGYDNAASAASKVAVSHLADSLEYAPSRQHYVSSGYASDGRYRKMWMLILFAVLVYFSYSAYNSSLISYMPQERHVNMDGSYADKKTLKSTLELFRGSSVARMKPIFADNSPVEEIFTHCRNKLCYEPDWSAYEKMRKWAARPAFYESEVCKDMMRFRGGYPVDPFFARDRKRQSTCVVTNWGEMKAAQKSLNDRLLIRVIGAFSVGVVFLFWLNRRLKKFD